MTLYIGLISGTSMDGVDAALLDIAPDRMQLQTALARETQEEAGLDLAPLQQLRRGGQVDFACPSEEGGEGAGYMLESIHWFHAVVPQGVQPQNMDEEVAQFQCITPQQLQAWLVQDRFTPEASLILADYLGW